MLQPPSNTCKIDAKYHKTTKEVLGIKNKDRIAAIHKCQSYQERKKRHLPYQIPQLQKKETLLQQVSSEMKEKFEKLVSTSTTFTPATITKEMIVETIETTATARGSEDVKGSKYSRSNFA